MSGLLPAADMTNALSVVRLRGQFAAVRFDLYRSVTVCPLFGSLAGGEIADCRRRARAT
jgi:hypothetical protein